MKRDSGQLASASLNRNLSDYHATTGQFSSEWIFLAVFNLLLQAIFYRALSPHAAGEFGILNAALGVIGLLAVPIVAIQQALRLFFQRAQETRLDPLRNSALTVLETAAWIWGGCCFFLVLVPLPLPGLPRFALQLFVLMNVVSGAGRRAGLRAFGRYQPGPALDVPGPARSTGPRGFGLRPDGLRAAGRNRPRRLRHRRLHHADPGTTPTRHRLGDAA